MRNFKRCCWPCKQGKVGKGGGVYAPEGAVTGGGWYYVLPDNLPHFSPLPAPLDVLLSHNYNSIVIQFWGRQINRISFLVTSHAPSRESVGAYQGRPLFF